MIGVCVWCVANWPWFGARGYNWPRHHARVRSCSISIWFCHDNFGRKNWNVIFTVSDAEPLPQLFDVTSFRSTRSSPWSTSPFTLGYDTMVNEYTQHTPFKWAHFTSSNAWIILYRHPVRSQFCLKCVYYIYKVRYDNQIGRMIRVFVALYSAHLTVNGKHTMHGF